MSGNLLDFEDILVQVPEAVGTPPATIPRKVLDYTRLQQEQTNWCWAAVTLAVAQYYAKLAGEEEPKLTQCEIVNHETGRTDCCDPGPAADGSKCNKVNVIYKALDWVGHYAHKKKPYKPPLADPKGEIDADRPLPLLILWTGSGGHFVALHGYDETAGATEDEAILHIADPWYGEALVPYGKFPEDYQGGGSWGWSYWTQPHATAGA